MPPLSLLIKPASGNCNMRCSYCFYIDEMKKRELPSYGMMSEETLCHVIRKSLAYAQEHCTIAFQGGEPTLIGLEFYQKVVQLVATWNVNACIIHYAIQTNGYCLEPAWFAFFKQYNFLVGVSLDGPEELHNQYRVDAKGNGTFHQVMETIAQLKEQQIAFNILTVVHAETVPKVNQLYNFFKRNQLPYQQYIECLDPIGEVPGQQAYSLTPELYGDFLIALFKKWYKDMAVGNYVYNRYFENLLGILTRKHPESCAMAGRCGDYLTIEADGSVYPCDFYVLDEWKMGNFQTNTIPEMITKRKDLQFVEVSFPVPDACQVCRWYPLCRNGCRRNCEPCTTTERGVNYFCTGYQRFFTYAYPYMEDLIRRYNMS